MPSKKVIVQNIFRNTDVEALESLLSKYGSVKCSYLWSTKNHRYHSCITDCKTCLDTDTNFAHVIFNNDDDAAKACDAANRHEVQLRNQTFESTAILRLTAVSADDAPIKILDDLCLMNILSLLPGRDILIAEQVCERWKQLAVRSWFRTKTLSLGGESVGRDALSPYLLRCGRFLNRLTFSTPMISLLSLVEECCQNLEYVNFSVRPSWREKNSYDKWLEAFRQLLIKQTKLRCLVLRDIGKEFDFDLINLLPSKMLQINFTAVDRWNTPGPLFLDLSGFYNLTNLVLRRFTIPEEGLGGLSTLSNLTHLDFTLSRVDHSILRSMSSLKQLRELLIPKCNITDDLLINVVINNRNLEILNISDNAALTDRSLQAVSELTNLKKLLMSNLPEVTLTSAGEMVNLEHLDCNGCDKVGNEPLAAILQASPNLRILNIYCSKITEDLFEIANAAVVNRDNAIPLKIMTGCWGPEKDYFSPLLTVYNPHEYDYLQSEDYDGGLGSDSD